ncbi:hypothetical protein [Vibrio parahaemolyticus]|uniref:hypothetical protein n=1 Tax=Vibrio parahaemolyticus TaxID=670 RepID=UPI00040C78E6|nr:hypothetical protein [Vibrio parahaemolyticus]HCH6231693.1 hypothetical protein [Vibrio parahaemolyticus]HCM1461385.1 hypothetical protein [Vibrio parahaemolyticus]HCM1465520.1 hypothetical protein [Vibrio parahaemolyticus]
MNKTKTTIAALTSLGLAFSANSNELVNFLYQDGVESINSEGVTEIKTESLGAVVELAKQDNLDVSVLGLTDGSVTIKFEPQEPTKKELKDYRIEDLVNVKQACHEYRVARPIDEIVSPIQEIIYLNKVN